MIKDLQQKMKAVRYCVALGIVPYMEVVVRFKSDISDTPSNITDVDVLGIKPCNDSRSHRIIFDCKTLNKMSPINRALWAHGLMALTDSDEAFVILLKSAPEVHRLAGNSLRVRLFTEGAFDKFAQSSAKDYSVINSYLEKQEAWDKLSEIPSKFPSVEPLLSFLNSSAALETDGKQGLRSLMSKCKKIEGELDPLKPEHRALFKLILSQLCFYMSEMVRDFHNIFSPEMDKEAFENILRYYIWGGKENYELRQRLNAAIQAVKGTTDNFSNQFEFPAWGQFVELFRSFLNAPLLLGSVCLPLKDAAFREICTSSPDLDRRLAQRLDANDRIRQFILASSSYLIAATRLPKDFKAYIEADMSL
jgi:hypothetical protein